MEDIVDTINITQSFFIKGNPPEVVSLTEEVKRDLEKQKIKQPYQYIQEWIGKKDLNKMNKEFLGLIEKSLPDKTLLPYYKNNAIITLYFEVENFVEIIIGSSLFNNKPLKRDLTMLFYRCIEIKGGIAYYHRKEFEETLLRQGKLILLEIFKNNKANDNIKLINNTLNELSDINDGLTPVKPFHHDKMNDFLVRKKDYYKETISIEDRENLEDVVIKNSNNGEIAPVFGDSIKDDFYNKLKIHFGEDDKKHLKQLLDGGAPPKGHKLYFMNNGNKLTDAFKKLIENNHISNCNKTELIEWICENFMFKKGKEACCFKFDTVKNVILTIQEIPCKNPLFEIEDGKIV